MYQGDVQFEFTAHLLQENKRKIKFSADYYIRG